MAASASAAFLRADRGHAVAPRLHRRDRNQLLAHVETDPGCSSSQEWAPKHCAEALHCNTLAKQKLHANLDADNSRDAYSPCAPAGTADAQKQRAAPRAARCAMRYRYRCRCRCRCRCSCSCCCCAAAIPRIRTDDLPAPKPAALPLDHRSLIA